MGPPSPTAVSSKTLPTPYNNTGNESADFPITQVPRTAHQRERKARLLDVCLPFNVILFPVAHNDQWCTMGEEN